MKRKYLGLLLLVMMSVNTNAQEKKLAEMFSGLPKEEIYVHVNDTFFLSGETLQYKVYGRLEKTKKPSSLSKIAYIELINNENKSIFKQKVRLENGVGFGDFFIDSNIKTGSYKLISYTQWMRNTNTFYEENIFIINPFLEKLTLKNSLVSTKEIGPKKEITSKLMRIETNKKSFQKREKVVVSYQLEAPNIQGNFSVSVKKITPLTYRSKTEGANVPEKEKTIQSIPKKFFLPELRGELIQGKVTSQSPELEVSQLKISLSITGENKQSKIAITNKKGVFYFNVTQSIQNEEAIFQILNKNKEHYKIEIINEPINTLFTNFPTIVVTEKLRKYIQKRSTGIQIENAYNAIKKEKLIPFLKDKDIFKENEFVYVLDDYKRFKTVKEVAIEILKDVWLSKNDDVYSFHVRDNNLETNTDLKTLLLVDGYVVYNHSNFIDFNAKKIKSISMVNEKYVFGSQLYQGIMNVKTFKNDYLRYSENNFKPFILRPLDKKNYFNPDFSLDTQKRIPDNRNQLLWQPNISKSKGEFSFYTSDITGAFKIEIKGFTNDGKQIAITKQVTVR